MCIHDNVAIHMCLYMNSVMYKYIKCVHCILLLGSPIGIPFARPIAFRD